MDDYLEGAHSGCNYLALPGTPCNKCGWSNPMPAPPTPDACEARAKEILDELSGTYGSETFVSTGYGYHEDALKLIAAALRAERERAIEECAKEAGDTSQLTTQPGNRFDEGYSQGRWEAMLSIRALGKATP